MRLTLRTLLAYLDDTLEPTESLEIGRKVAENEQARELMDRIKKSVRKRSLAVPVSQAPGDTADANTVAQYLSDTLSPDQVADFEKVCLENDLNLAEAAACHQILTLLQVEQIRIPPATRRRMYDLADEPMALPNRKPARAVSIASLFDESRSEDRGEDDAYLMGLSAMSRKEPARVRYGRLILAASLLSLFALSLYMVWPNSPESPREPLSYATVVPGGKSNEPAPAATTTTIPPAAISKNEAPPPPRTSTTEPKPKDATTTPATPMPDATPKELPPVPPPSNDRANIGRREASSAVVLRTLGGSGPIDLLMPDEPLIASTDRFTALPGYKAAFKLDSEVSVELWGNLPDLVPLSPVREASFTPTVPREAVAADLTLHAGRFYIAAKRPRGGRVRLRIGTANWIVELPDEKAEIVVEVVRRLLPGSGEPRVSWTVGLHVLQGQIELYTTRTKKEKLTRGQELYWTSADDKTRVERESNAGPTRGQYWSRYVTTAEAKSGKSILELLEKIAKNSTGKDKLREALGVALEDKTAGQSPEQVQRTTTAAAMFAALGDLDALSDAINDDRRFWIREAAVQGLRSSFADDPAKIEEFRKILKDKPRLPEDLADEVILLLRDFTPEERANPNTLDRLLRDMDNPNALAIPVRELAFRTLLTFIEPLDAKDADLRFFDAGGVPEARKPVVAAWDRKIKELKKSKDAVPPVPKP